MIISNISQYKCHVQKRSKTCVHVCIHFSICCTYLNTHAFYILFIILIGSSKDSKLMTVPDTPLDGMCIKDSHLEIPKFHLSTTFQCGIRSSACSLDGVHALTRHRWVTWPWNVEACYGMLNLQWYLVGWEALGVEKIRCSNSPPQLSKQT